MVNVSLKYCNDYDYLKVEEALLSSIEDLGGLSKFIDKGDRVLLKVNLLMRKRPEDATTTHPVFVEAMANILINYGAKVVIGDSPGGPFSERMLKGIYKTTGMEDVALKTGAKLNYNTASFQKVNPNGLLIKKITLTDMLNDVDKVISVSKLKTHGMMTFTGAVKNMFGVVPGILKAEYHLNMPDYDNFGIALVDICVCANPVLSFMDGIVGMEGVGPSAGTPRHINVIIASDSPYHLDKAACHIIGLEFEKVPTIKASINRNLCAPGLEDIKFTGEDINKFEINDFKLPKPVPVRVISDLPFFIKGFVNKHLQPRPVFDHNTCVGCKICDENCPAKVIAMDDKNKPDVDLKGCIRCYCCQELCPQKAVSIYRPLILRTISKY